ncbi:MAG TPA: carboxylesterase family protein [Solirubrobacteraceae bacterium]|nr:carboxylesterase family protein [Solirubrobacteraceae bacterium]
MESVVVRTAAGAVRGVRRETGVLFGGIPYAAPPVGDLRFMAPQPAAPWAGTLDATAQGPPLPQPVRVLPGLRSDTLLGGWDGQAPALTLNVWTPAPGASGLPVLVWLHGGAFVAGSPAQAVYDGSAWMRDGVVLVTVGYRLGVEGFVHFAGGDSNVGLRDQLAALEWVQSEIGAFGGDPSRVCVGGQSAGAMSIGWLLGSERSRGLFARAISMSGGLDLTLSGEQADRVAAHVARTLSVEATAESMRALPVSRVVEAQGAITPDQLDLDTAADRDPGGGLLWVMPVRDGEIVAEDPVGAIGTVPDVDLLAGCTSEEGLLYLAGVPGFDAMPLEAAEAFAGRLTPDAAAMLAAFRAEQPDASPGELAARAITEVAFRAPTERLLRRHAELGSGATHAYRFSWRSGALGGRLGAAHAVDLPFSFDTLDTPGASGTDDALLGTEGGPQELATRMHAAWVRYVEDGDPGWAPYEHVQLFGGASTRLGEASAVV